MDLSDHVALSVLHDVFVGVHLLVLLVLLSEDLSDHGSQGVHEKGLEVFVCLAGSEAS